jgi:hypothetical protein
MLVCWQGESMLMLKIRVSNCLELIAAKFPARIAITFYLIASIF